MMFDNYKLGVNSSTVKHELEDDSTGELSISVSDYIKKDKYGNIIGLNWNSSSRFTLELTSDIWIPIAVGAIVFDAPGENPSNIVPDGIKYAYNTADYMCWRYDSTEWIEQPDIVEFINSSNIALFSKKNCTTKIDIKNFRGESVLTATGTNLVSIVVDDDTAEKLCQGFYTANIYRECDGDVTHIRRIPLSISDGSITGPFARANNGCKTTNINKSCNMTI